MATLFHAYLECRRAQVESLGIEPAEATSRLQARAYRHPDVTVDAGGGTNNATVAGPAEFADDVAFTIVIP